MLTYSHDAIQSMIKRPTRGSQSPHSTLRARSQINVHKPASVASPCPHRVAVPRRRVAVRLNQVPDRAAALVYPEVAIGAVEARAEDAAGAGVAEEGVVDAQTRVQLHRP